MRYRFTARAALLGALALALTPAMVAGPAQAGNPAPRLAQQRGPAPSVWKRANWTRLSPTRGSNAWT